MLSVMIGIDPAKGSHAAAAVNGGEEVLAELEVRASRRQTSELLAWAERFPLRRWAIALRCSGDRCDIARYLWSGRLAGQEGISCQPL